MSLLRLDIRAIYGRAMATDAPHKFLALSMGRWLRKTAESLEDRGYCFEAGAAEALARDFELFSERDGSPEGLAGMWGDLIDWGETSVTTISGREKSLCEIPHLPDALSC